MHIFYPFNKEKELWIQSAQILPQYEKFKFYLISSMKMHLFTNFHDKIKKIILDRAKNVFWQFQLVLISQS